MADQTPAKSVWVEFISKFDTKNLKEAEKRVGKTTQALKKLGVAAGAAFAAAAAGLALMTRQVLKAGDVVDKESKKIGESAEGYQQLVAVFDDMGIGAGAASKGIQFLRKEIGRGDKASIEFRDALAQAGLKPEDLTGLDAYSQYEKIIDAIRPLGDELQTSIAQATLGRGGKELTKILNAPPEALEEARQRYLDAGGAIFSEEDATRAATMGDELNAIGRARRNLQKSLVFAIFEDVDPEDIREITKSIAGMAKWVKENSKLVKGLTKAFFAVTAVIAVLGTVISGVAIYASAFGAALVAAAGAAITPFLAVAAAVAGIGLAVYQVIKYWDDLGRSIDYVVDKFQSFAKSTVGKALGFVFGESTARDFGFGEEAPRQPARVPESYGIGAGGAGAPSAEQPRGAGNTVNNSSQANTYNIQTTMSQAQLEAFLRKRDAKRGRAGQRN